MNPTTASARPVLPALPCGEQSKHHVARTNEATDNTTEGVERAFAPGKNPTLASALGRPRRSGPTLSGQRRSDTTRGGDGIRRASPPARFSSAVNAE